MSADLRRRDILAALPVSPLLSFPAWAESPADQTAWFRAAKFGMFIHWGPYSLASVEASWPIMRPRAAQWRPLTESEYRQLPSRFNPAGFDPAAWVRLARAAGQRYMELPARALPKFRSAALLESRRSLEFRQDDQRVVIQLPAQAPDPDVTVIALRAA